MENTIHIENLTPKADVAYLCDLFRSCGRILSANIECNSDGKSLGKACITFSDYASASNSVKLFQIKKIADRHINVYLAIEKKQFSKIFVKNFSRDWDECDLIEVFEKFGTVETAKVAEEFGNSLGYGFVVFKTHAGAKRAVEALNGADISGSKLIVERFKDFSERDSLQQGSLEYAEQMLKNSTQRNNLFVKNLSKNVTDIKLREVFKKYGEILSCVVASDEEGNHKGYGFVCFKNAEDAENALKKKNGTSLDGKPLLINFKQDRNARTRYLALKNKESVTKVEQYKQRSRSTSALQFRPVAVTHTRTLMKI